MGVHQAGGKPDPNLYQRYSNIEIYPTVGFANGTKLYTSGLPSGRGRLTSTEGSADFLAVAKPW